MAADKSVLESLAFLYLTFSHSTDGEVSGDEMKALAAKLREWAPSVELGELGELLKSTVARYKGAADKLGEARTVTGSLEGALDKEQLGKVLADLEELAAADGEVIEAEKTFIADTREAFGL